MAFPNISTKLFVNFLTHLHIDENHNIVCAAISSSQSDSYEYVLNKNSELFASELLETLKNVSSVRHTWWGM